MTRHAGSIRKIFRILQKGLTYRSLFLLAFMGLILSSCSIERRIAKEYIASDSTRTVLVMAPDFLFKTSLKDWQIDSVEQDLGEWAKDSILLERSLYLRNIDDSLFIRYYMDNYIAELEALGFTVYEEDSLLSFLSGKPGSYIVNIAQLELEEYVMPYTDEEQIGDYIYSEVVDLNALNLNSWIEVSKVNEEAEKALFFASHYLTDALEGYFRQFYFTGEVQYRYEIDTLAMNDVYLLGGYAGYLYATYTFDYLMNMYIDKRVFEEGANRTAIYYHYDRLKDFLRAAKEGERFIQME